MLNTRFSRSTEKRKSASVFSVQQVHKAASTDLPLSPQSVHVINGAQGSHGSTGHPGDSDGDCDSATAHPGDSATCTPR